MKKNTKKKLFTLMLVIILLAITIVGGSLAWFTDEDEVTNVFTVGTIGITQHEKDENDQVFDASKYPLLPVITPDSSKVTEDPNYVAKRVNVENTGSNPAYIRTWIAIPTKLIGYLHFINDKTGWTEQEEHPTFNVKDVNYTGYCYVYDSVLEVGKSTNELLKGVYLGSEVDIKDNPNTTTSPNLEFCKPDGNVGYTFSGFEIATPEGKVLEGVTVNVLVATQAIQKEGFNSAEEALNTAFGDLSEEDCLIPFDLD